jgi:predicted PolB exonuclease-like 3'-5' exonuclease
VASYRVLDIETVTDRTFWTPPEERYVLAPRGPFTPRTDAVGDYDLSSFVAPAGVVLADQFPPPHAHRVVAMSWVDMGSDDGKFYFFERYSAECAWSHTTPGEPEKMLLAAFAAAMDADKALIVTWNGRTFDMPVIAMRSLLHKIPMGWYYTERDRRYRYNDSGHCDLMDYFADYGAGRQAKLGDIARVCGLPGKTGEVSGSSVASEHAKGDDEVVMARVADYCLSDTMQTAVLFVRSRFHKGVISVKEHNLAISSFVDSGALVDALGASYDPSPLFV